VELGVVDVSFEGAGSGLGPDEVLVVALDGCDAG